MKSRFFISMAAIATALAAVSLAPVDAVGQTTTAAAETWTPPRTPDGQPDIQGYWSRMDEPAAPAFPTYTLEGGHLFDKRPAVHEQWERAAEAHSIVVDPPSGRIPYQPWALAKRQERFEAHTHPTKPEYIDPRARCFLPGVPRTTYSGLSQIIQIAGYVVMMNEFTHAPRIIPLDGRPHVAGNIRLWQGDSRGHWDGNTLVVETTNLTDKTWLDIVGNFHSEALHVAERFTFVGPDTIRYLATLEDPKVFTGPWTLGFTLRRNTEPGFELFEEACVEGERSTTEMLQPASAKPTR